MKATIHPTWYPNATVTCQCGKTWETGATVPQIRTEICSNCHPFFTGEQRIVDTEGRVDKFLKRLQRRDEIRTQQDVAGDGDSSASMAVSELGLNKQTVKILKDNNLNSVAEILNIFSSAGEDGISGIDGLGQQGLIDIKKALRAKGIEFPSA